MRFFAGLLPSLTLVALICWIGCQGLDARFLWQDEVETAERARSILASGLPLVVDPFGKPSLNTGGLEIEDGNVHRFSPWVQYYTAAAGLALARLTEHSDDWGVRMPFVVAHALCSGFISHGLYRWSGFSLPGSFLAGLAFATQSERVIYNRTARYHALLDLFLVVGLYALGAIGNGSRRATVLLTVAVSLLPHVHTFSGTLWSGVLTLLALFVFKRDRAGGRGFIRWLKWGPFPHLTSVALLIALVRPWRQGVWESVAYGTAPSLLDRGLILYWFGVLLIWICLLLTLKRQAQALGLFGLALVIASGIAVLDMLSSYSQSRYYLSLSIVALFLVIALPSPDWRYYRRSLTTLMLLAIACHELYITNALGAQPFHGVHVVLNDRLWKERALKQPLTQAFDYLRREARSDEPVFVDYVPQYVNWYLPGYTPALVPDLTARHAHNRENKLWDAPGELPVWHLWYYGRGFWTCGDKCDSHAFVVNWAKQQYFLYARRLNHAVRMCIKRTWTTHVQLNAPYVTLTPQGLDPAAGDQTLILARACEADSFRLQASPKS